MAGCSQYVLKIHHEAAQVIQGDHGHPVANECVVGIVPFRTLCVHPNAPFRNEVGHFREHRRHDFLNEIHFIDENVCFTQQGSITPNLVLLESDSSLALVVELDGVLGILKQFFVRLNAIRHVGVHERVVGEVFVELFRVIRLQELEELQEVNDLVITPVSDVRPGVIRLNGLPFKPVLEDAVRVVPIKRRRVQELENHPLDELRV